MVGRVALLVTATVVATILTGGMEQKNIFFPVSPLEHADIHRMFGYGNGNGGYNQYYMFDNVWAVLHDMFR